ncbi:unnamed protein product [Rhodiola kirilowii]
MRPDPTRPGHNPLARVSLAHLPDSRAPARDKLCPPGPSMQRARVPKLTLGRVSQRPVGPSAWHARDEAHARSVSYSPGRVSTALCSADHCTRPGHVSPDRAPLKAQIFITWI